jgi:site-specific recombinase XerC
VERPGPRERTVPEAEFEAAMKTATPPAQLFLLLAHDEGLRAGTIARIRKHNCDLEKKELRGATKGGANYAVPMTARVHERLAFVCAAAEAGETLLGTVSYRRKPINHKSVQELVRTAKHRAGITSDWTLHDLRRGAARRLYERTRDVRKVQRLLSHKNLSTTMWYLGDAGTDLDPSDLETELERKEKSA